MRKKIRIIAVFAILLLSCHLVLTSIGLPPYFRNKLGCKLSKEYAFESSALKINLLGTVVLNDVKFYRKGIVGPPFLTAKKMKIGFSLFKAVVRKMPLVGVEIVDGEIIPSQAVGRKNNTIKKQKRNAEIGFLFENCLISDVFLKRCEGIFSMYDDNVFVRNIDAIICDSVSSGKVGGEISISQGAEKIEGNLNLEINPHILIPVMQNTDLPSLVKLTKRFSFDDSTVPRWALRFSYLGGKDYSINVDGAFWFQNFSYNGVTADRADGRLLVQIKEKESRVYIEPLLIVRPEGSYDGGFMVDLGKDIVEFRGNSSMDPKSLAKLIGVMDDNDMRAWRFNGHVKMSASGVCGLSSYSNMNFHLDVEGEKVGLGILDADSTTFTIAFHDGTGKVSNLKGKMYGGEFNGSVEILLPGVISSSLYYRVDCTALGADFGRAVTAITGEKNEYRGKMNLYIDIEGPCAGETFQFARGDGQIFVRKGKVFLLPLFGGLTRFMAVIIPGFQFIFGQSDVSSVFVIEDGRIKTKEILIEGDIFSLDGRGNYSFDGNLDFNVRLQFLKKHTLGGKVMQKITYPISKLFEFKLNGTIKNPHWYPVNFSPEFLRKKNSD